MYSTMQILSLLGLAAFHIASAAPTPEKAPVAISRLGDFPRSVGLALSESYFTPKHNIEERGLETRGLPKCGGVDDSYYVAINDALEVYNMLVDFVEKYPESWPKWSDIGESKEVAYTPKASIMVRLDAGEHSKASDIVCAVKNILDNCTRGGPNGPEDVAGYQPACGNGNFMVALMARKYADGVQQTE